jgi:hypothetical protein
MRLLSHLAGPDPRLASMYTTRVSDGRDTRSRHGTVSDGETEHRTTVNDSQKASKS